VADKISWARGPTNTATRGPPAQQARVRRSPLPGTGGHRRPWRGPGRDGRSSPGLMHDEASEEGRLITRMTSCSLTHHLMGHKRRCVETSPLGGDLGCRFMTSLSRVRPPPNLQRRSTDRGQNRRCCLWRYSGVRSQRDPTLRTDCIPQCRMSVASETAKAEVTGADAPLCPARHPNPVGAQGTRSQSLQ